MSKRRDREQRPAADSQVLRQLVHLALHDDSTFMEDGAFDEFEHARSERYAFDLRRLLTTCDPSEEDARFILAEVRAPGIDVNRAAVLIRHCIAVQHLREPFWSRCVQRLVNDPEPRVRVLAVRAEIYAPERAIADESSEVRIEAQKQLANRRKN